MEKLMISHELSRHFLLARGVTYVRIAPQAVIHCSLYARIKRQGNHACIALLNACLCACMHGIVQ